MPNIESASPRVCLATGLLVALCILMFAMWGAPAFAEASATTITASEPALRLPPDARTPAPAKELAAAPVIVFNRTIAVLRTPIFGISAQERAQRGAAHIVQLLERDPTGEVGVKPVNAQQIPQGNMLTIDGSMALILVADDADVLHDETLDSITAAAVANLQQAIEATRESRNLHALLISIALAAAATVIFILLVRFVFVLRKKLSARLLRLVDETAANLKLAGTELVRRDRVLQIMRSTITLAHWLLIALFSYEWLSFVLARFPYTRPWGEQLHAYFLNAAANGASATLKTLPKLFIAFVIFLLARTLIRILQPLFERVAEGRVSLGWLDHDTVQPTRRIVVVLIWVFALVMAYPYLPGADTDAFKGMSVLIGLMISLGASSIVGQAASGMILMFSRTLRVGEYVKVDAHEGTVVELGMFNTRIRTGLGEEVTLPNSLIVGSATTNYSRAVEGRGYVVDTVVTIGYDTPWRQVHAILIEAARRTPGILPNPEPRVFQTSLSDFYPEYRLVCQAVPEAPRPRAEVLANLHANIQDVFNEYGIQMMSPHYFSDPDHSKTVPREQWYAAPAKAPEEQTSARIDVSVP